MEIKKIPVPEGIRYLSQWTDFGKELPDSHFILNKAHTDVGGTQYFLTNNEKVILCSPRCSLMESKKQKHPDVCFYRDMSDNAQVDGDGKKPKPKKKATYDDIKKYNDEVVKYIRNCYMNYRTPKLMVTYDSLHHIVDALNSMSPTEITTWTLVIDEFQVIFDDSNFKSLTEMMFLDSAQNFKKAIFMSATPYMREYLEWMDEFKDLPYLELEWPKDMEESVIVTNIVIKKGESRNKVCKKIIDCMRTGKTVKLGTKEIDTKEAVFYLNNVSDLINIVKACQLKPDEVNILCSKSNEDKLKKAGLSMGTFPQEFEPHKMITLATKSVYLGVDFYSECAFSYIFADPSQRTLALDIVTELPQILGRQRLSRNPYRNEAVLFMKENSIGLEDKEFAEYIDKKKKDTEALINGFNSMTPELKALNIPKYRSSMERDRYKNDYLMVIDKAGQPEVAFNTLYMFAEMRAWELSKKKFVNTYTVIKEQQKAGITGVTGTQSQDPDVLEFKKQFEATNITNIKIQTYCYFRQQHPELVDKLDFVSPKYSGYWDAFGYDDLKALGFQESKIRLALSETTNPFEQDAVIKEVRERLEVKRYEVGKLKEELQKAYEKAGYKKVAKAKDVVMYLSSKPYQDSKTGKRYIDIQSKYQKNITMFPFVWRPNVPMPTTIDRFLDIIQTGKYTMKKSNTGETRMLKDVIDEIRSIDDHDKQGEIKREWLPVACINGVFKYKDDHGIEIYSSFVALDYDQFDSIEEMEKAEKYIQSLPFTYATFLTASGVGFKSIVLHDSVKPDEHWNLYQQIMNACRLPQSDTGVTDLSRGQFLSYDKNLWRNPDPKPFHYEFDPSLVPPTKAKEKYISTSEKDTDMNNTRLDLWTEKFLHSLWQTYLTDDAIIERLDKYWSENKPEYYKVGNRHKSMLIMAGTLCKAGIPKDRTKDYLLDSYPEKDESEIDSIIEYAYDNNPWGCDRRTYKKK